MDIASGGYSARKIFRCPKPGVYVVMLDTNPMENYSDVLRGWEFGTDPFYKNELAHRHLGMNNNLCVAGNAKSVFMTRMSAETLSRNYSYYYDGKNLWP
jgi:hypothetical protein